MDKTTQFINRYLHDIQRILENRLHACALEGATEEADQIMKWLFPLMEPLSAEKQLERVAAVLNDESQSAEDRRRKIKRIVLSTGRRKGHPRTETSQQAIRALSLHYATKRSWREIALVVRGCNHKRPNPERSCEACGDAIRDAAGRLEKFLISIGLDPRLPQ